ncbi:hypothetical protein GZ77_14620 [Endozoicomonas montiporae]|uniref:Uncharacterized protein n=2 Tax=Endozoicomonas montiporae TaxID=1027273 RepID=A0A081N535_9GAMM|nr:hypothetical protein [Endozoicomonas montiporae]AMO57565.1 hypothetical protein EZMO1_3585 [Endozoicomonas montiporae CL-33]KEQ13558.1 hypothetical protein GZ77_14620 [Endozoicomonas montiporae]
MSNKRPGFIKSAIAAAISSSFICTTLSGEETDFGLFVWKHDGTQLLPEPVTHSYPKADSVNFFDNIETSGKDHDFTQPYLQQVHELKSKGITVTIQTGSPDVEGSARPSRFAVIIHKNNIPLLAMTEDLASGDVRFHMHPHLKDAFTNKLSSELGDTKLTESDTGIVTVAGTRRVLEKLATIDELQGFENENFITFATESVAVIEQTAPFINDLSPGTHLPEKVAMVDTDSAIAAMTTAWVSKQLPQAVGDHPLWKGDTDGDPGKPSPLRLMLANQPGIRFGARKVEHLAGINTPVFLFKQETLTDPVTATYIPHSGISTAYLKRHQLMKEAGEFEPLKMTRDTVKDLRQKAFSASFKKLIQLSADYQTSGTTPDKADMEQLAAFEEVRILCDAKLRKKWQTTTFSPEEQSGIAVRVHQKSLPDLIQSQFSLNPEISGFVLSDAFTGAASLLPDTSGAIPSDDGLEHIDKYIESNIKRYHRMLGLSAKVAPHTREEAEEVIRKAAGAEKGETLLDAAKRVSQKIANLKTDLKTEQKEKADSLKNILLELGNKQKKFTGKLESLTDKLDSARNSFAALKQTAGLGKDATTEKVLDVLKKESEQATSVKVDTEDELSFAKSEFKVLQDKNIELLKVLGITSDDELIPTVEKLQTDLTEKDRQYTQLLEEQKTESNRDLVHSAQLKSKIETAANEKDELDKKLGSLAALLGIGENEDPVPVVEQFNSRLTDTTEQQQSLKDKLTAAVSGVTKLQEELTTKRSEVEKLTLQLGQQKDRKNQADKALSKARKLTDEHDAAQKSLKEILQPVGEETNEEAAEHLQYKLTRTTKELGKQLEADRQSAPSGPPIKQETVASDSNEKTIKRLQNEIEQLNAKVETLESKERDINAAVGKIGETLDGTFPGYESRGAATSTLQRISDIDDFKEQGRGELERKVHSTTYLRRAKNELLDPELVMHETILSYTEFSALKELNLPEDMQPEAIVNWLRYMAPLVDHFQEESTTATIETLVEDLDTLKSFLLQPDTAGELPRINPEKKGAFESHIREKYQTEDTDQFLQVITRFNANDVQTFGNAVSSIKVMDESLLDRLERHHILSVLGEGDYETLASMHEVYKHAPEKYENTWQQIMLENFQRWLVKTPVVPSELELDEFPNEDNLPSESTLAALKVITGIAPDHLTAGELTRFVKSAGVVLSRIEEKNQGLFYDDLSELHKYIDSSTKVINEAYLKGLAEAYGIDETALNDLVTLTKQPKWLIVNTFESIKTYGGIDKVQPLHITEEDIKLARSRFDSQTVMEAQKYRKQYRFAYHEKVRSQNAAENDFKERMAKIGNIVVDDEVYSSAELAKFPEDEALRDLRWADPLRDLRLMLPNQFNKEQVILSARLLTRLTDSEYDILINAVDTLVPLIDDTGALPRENEAEFDKALAKVGLQDRSQEVLGVVQLLRNNSRVYLKKLQTEVRLLGRHPESSKLTVKHLDIAQEKANPKKILEQRKVLQENPDLYDDLTAGITAYNKGVQAREWLQEHEKLVVMPKELMSETEHHALRRFVNAVASKWDYEEDKQHSLIRDIVSVRRVLTHIGNNQLLEQLAAQPGLTPGRVLDAHGQIADPEAFAVIASRLGVTRPTDQSTLGKLFQYYASPEKLKRVSAELGVLADAGLSPDSITPIRLQMINHPSPDEVDLAGRLAREAPTEYAVIWHAIRSKTAIAEIEEIEQELSKFDAVKSLTARYLDSGDFDAEQFEQQEALVETLTQVQEELKNVKLLGYKEDPGAETPHYNELKAKLESLPKNPTLRGTRQQIKDLENDPLVNTADKLAVGLKIIIDTDLPDRERFPDGSDMPKFDSHGGLKTRGHTPPERKAELQALETLINVKDPAEFKRQWETFVANKELDINVDATVHRDMLKLQILIETPDPEWSQKQAEEALGIITPWIEDPSSDTARGFLQYLSVKRHKARMQKAMKKAINAGKETPILVQKYIREAFGDYVAIQGIDVAKVRHDLYNAAMELESIENFRTTLLDFKRTAEQPEALELEGMTTIAAALDQISKDSTNAEVLHAARKLQPRDLGLAKRMANDISKASATASKTIPTIEGDYGLYDDIPDINPDRYQKDVKRIEAFYKECRECNLDPTELVGKPGGHPDTEKVRQLHQWASSEYEELNMIRSVARMVTQYPGKTVTSYLTLEKQNRQLEAEKTTFEQVQELLGGTAEVLATTGFVKKAAKQRLYDDQELKQAILSHLKPLEKEAFKNKDVQDFIKNHLTNRAGFKAYGPEWELILTGRDPETEETITLDEQELIVEQLFSGSTAPIYKIPVSEKLEADDATYIDEHLELDLGSAEALVMGDLLRLKQAGVPLEAFELFTFTTPVEAVWLKALANDKINPESLVAITHRLIKNSKHFKPMLDKMREIEGISGRYQKRHVIAVLQKNAEAMDPDTPESSARAHINANKTEQSYMQFLRLFQRAIQKNPRSQQQVTETMEFYVRDGYAVDPDQRAPQQDDLDQLGLTKEMCVNWIKYVTKNNLFPGKNKAQLLRIALLDASNAYISQYEDSIQPKVTAMKAYASQAATTLKDGTYSVGISSLYTAEALIYLHFRNRLNVYLDDIAYNKGRNLIAAIRGSAEGLDEFLRAAGLVSGEHQKQVISDILNFFGREFLRVYDEKFQHVLGDRADFMNNVLRPAAFLVQAPVGAQEIGAVLQFNGENAVFSWNTAWHSLQYAAVGVIADMTRGSQYNKMMIEAIDPAMKNFAAWMDGVAPLYSDQSSPEDRYYTDTWLSIAKGWNGFHDYMGQTMVMKAGRPLATVAQNYISTKIWGKAFIPILNARTFAITNPARAAQGLPAQAYWSPGFGSVVAYHVTKAVFYDWAYNGLADAKYGLEGWAEMQDRANGVPADAKESSTKWVKNNLQKYSLNAEDTYFAPGRDYAWATPVTDRVKEVATMGARVAKVTGLDTLSGYEQGTYNMEGKPDFASRSREQNFVSSWIGTIGGYTAWAMNESGFSANVLLPAIGLATPPVNAGIGVLKTTIDTAASMAYAANEKRQDAEGWIYKNVLGYHIPDNVGTASVTENKASPTDPENSQNTGNVAGEKLDQNPPVSEDEPTKARTATRRDDTDHNHTIDTSSTEQAETVPSDTDNTEESKSVASGDDRKETPDVSKEKESAPNKERDPYENDDDEDEDEEAPEEESDEPQGRRGGRR